MRRVAGRMRRYGFSLLVLVLGGAVATIPVVRDGPGTVVIVAFFVVLLSAWYGGMGPGLMITGLITLTTAGAPSTPWRAVRTALFAAGGVAISALAEVQHAARRRSEQSRGWLAAVLASSGDAVIATDADVRVAFLNPVAESLIGRAAEDAVGRPLAEVFRIIDEQTRRPVENSAGRALREGIVVGLADRAILVAADGSERPIRDSAAPIRDRRGTVLGVVLVFYDDTPRREHERELVEANRRKDEFLAMLAHELRNPLAAIRAAVAVVEMPGADDHTGWAMEVIDRQANHLAHLLDDLLDVSRITRNLIHLRKQPIDARQVLQQAVGMVRSLIDDRRHHLDVRLATGPLRLEADPVRLEQVLVNLLSNAAKYSPPGGRIRLTADRIDDQIVFRVRDDGVGIPPDVLPRIFDLFAQGERTLGRAEGGLGVGLTIVRTLVEQHGGSVSAASEGEGRGSEFTVRLPAAEGPAPSPPAAPADHGRRPRARILIVDDNRELAQGMSRVLSKLGHEVEVSYDGPEGIEAARAFHPDVVLLDIGMPTMDGYQVASRLRREEGLTGIRIIAISGYGQEEDRRRSIEAGMDHHLVKPVDIQTLSELIATPA